MMIFDRVGVWQEEGGRGQGTGVPDGGQRGARSDG